MWDAINAITTGLFFQILFYILILFGINVIIGLKLGQYHEHFISTVDADGRVSVATVLSIHPCFSSC